MDVGETVDIVGAQEKALGMAFEAVLYQNFRAAKRGVRPFARGRSRAADAGRQGSCRAMRFRLAAGRNPPPGQVLASMPRGISPIFGRFRALECFLYGKALVRSAGTAERTCSLGRPLLPFPLVFRLEPFPVPVRASEAGIFWPKRGLQQSISKARLRS